MFKIKKLPKETDMYGLYYHDKFVKGGYVQELKNQIADTRSKDEQFKEKFHCLENCTECCHQLVSLLESDLFKIKRALRKLPKEELERLKNQERNHEYCPLLDVQKGTCSVYESRPNICRGFGMYQGALSCSYNLDIPLLPINWFMQDMIDKKDTFIGTLGKEFTWEKGLIK